MKEIAVKFTIQMLIEESNQLPLSIPIHTIERPCERVEDIGLHVGEAKALLGTLQNHVVRSQLAQLLDSRRPCGVCHQPRTLKGYHSLQFRTAFGDVALKSPRWYSCACEARPLKTTFSPLAQVLTTHIAPELEFLQAKWAAHLSFGAVADLLHDVLPVDTRLHGETVREHVLATAERLEADLGPEQVHFDAFSQRDIEASPDPGAPVTVGLDGGYVRGRDKKAPGANGCFEVIAGKSIPEDGNAKVFALVKSIDQKPRRRLHEVLAAQGVLPRQRVTFLSDGGDSVRSLPGFLHPHSEHMLDWFHIAVRIEQLSQTARGVSGIDANNRKDEILHQLQRTKWFLWHGNVLSAEDTVVNLLDDIDGVLAELDYLDRENHAVLKRLSRTLTEFNGYIVNNRPGIPNYGERYRCHERISTGFVESTINQLVAKRMVKKQQMRWTPRGAHLLLQIRANVLNDDLAAAFRRWYPGFGGAEEAKLAA